MEVAIFVLAIQATWVVGFRLQGVEWLEGRGLRTGKNAGEVAKVLPSNHTGVTVQYKMC